MAAAARCHMGFPKKLLLPLQHQEGDVRMTWILIGIKSEDWMVVDFSDSLDSGL